MEFPVYFCFYFLLGVAGFAYLMISRLTHVDHRPPLPPGSYGWPIIGETLKLRSMTKAGKINEFLKQKMTEKNPNVFKTSIFGEKTIVFTGAAGLKFLFTAEKGSVLTCWPDLLKKLFGDSFINAPYDDAIRTRKLVMKFLNQEILNEFVGKLDKVCKQRMEEGWVGKNQVIAFSLIRKYSFSIACKIFVGIEDSEYQMKLLKKFHILVNGLFQLPIYFPGTKHYGAVKSAGFIQRELMKVIESKRREKNLEEDLISHLMVTRDDEGKLLTDKEIADNIILLLEGGHETSSRTMMMMIKYLAENPECYDRVLREQREIVMSKRPGELLNKEDIQKMKYSWNVVTEVLRISPPVQGTFRKAIKDFTYAGFLVPKGWKISWVANSTHMNEKYFPNPEKFDPSRFERETPTPYTFVPFGGGPRMCPGKELARLEIIVFLHNLVREFRWELVYPDEKITIDPMPNSEKGLPIYLYSHTY